MYYDDTTYLDWYVHFKVSDPKTASNGICMAKDHLGGIAGWTNRLYAYDRLFKLSICKNMNARPDSVDGQDMIITFDRQVVYFQDPGWGI